VRDRKIANDSVIFNTMAANKLNTILNDAMI